jgi:hypothetical protein
MGRKGAKGSEPATSIVCLVITSHWGVLDDEESHSITRYPFSAEL